MGDYQDWEPVVLRKHANKPKTDAEKKQALTNAQRSGASVETVKKCTLMAWIRVECDEVA